MAKPLITGNREDFPVRFINYRYEHASDHSGYNQIGYRLGSGVTPIDRSNRRSRIIPGRIASLLCRRSGNVHYGYDHFYLELSAAVDMLRVSGCVYHFLWGDDMFRYLGLIPRFRGHRILATMHYPPARLAQLVPRPGYLRRLDGVVVLSTNQIPFFENLMGKDRVFLIPHGVDTDVFSPGTRCDRNPRLCLFVGAHLRDFDTLRKTIQLVNDRALDIQFVVVTHKTEFPRFVDLENIDLRCGIPEAELLRLYQQASVMIQPMIDSTANNALLEAMACGLPVVASDVGGVRDYADETCSVLVPPGDPETMADAVVDLVSDEVRRTRLGTGAYRKAQDYSWENIIDQLKEVYTVILAR
jgi:glycosyltransferase involved in cell wall biosynthesis